MIATDIAYIAGLLDGEGSISIIHQKSPRKNNPRHRIHCLYINITNTNKEAIDYVAHKLQIGSIRTKPVTVMKANWKTIYWWEIRGPKAALVLSMLLPYLIIKQERARLAIEFQQRCSEGRYNQFFDRTWQSEYCQKIRNINFTQGAAKQFRPCMDISTLPIIWNKGLKTI